MRVDFPALLGPTKKALLPRIIVNLSKALKFHKSSLWIRMDSPRFVTVTLSRAVDFGQPVILKLDGA